MRRLSTVTRIALGLVFMVLAVMFAAEMLGLIPDRTAAIVEGRTRLADAMAVQCSFAARHDDLDSIAATLAALKSRQPEVVSAALRSENNVLAVVAGDHENVWRGAAPELSTPDYIRVPIFKQDKRWATVEIAFVPLARQDWLGYLNNPAVRRTLFIAAASFLLILLYLRRTLRYLDPSAVIPDRVRNMLNALTEGVLVLDHRERVVLINEVLAQSLHSRSDQFIGKSASELGFELMDAQPATPAPWTQTLADGQTRRAVPMLFRTGPDQVRTLMVSSAPIVANDGSRRGALITFDDVTSVEQTNQRLREALHELELSRDELDRKNAELVLLATRDPLTGCLNRRSFYQHLDAQWSSAIRYKHALGCIMIDLDFFKAINDHHGHATGDQVLQVAAQLFAQGVRPCDYVGRYGGEEFCILLPHTDLDGAYQAAERLRQLLVTKNILGLNVTASMGVSSTDCRARNTKELLDQADQALYVAKRRSRNTVVRFDEVPADLETEPAASGHADDARSAHAASSQPELPRHPVQALVVALAHRDAATAIHAQRVAEYCVRLADGLMKPAEVATLEVAGLLHDIGKLGVPDAILRKPGPLTPEERRTMDQHNRIGEQVVATAFACPPLTRLVEMHHAHFGGNPEHPALPQGRDIPLGARILSIADAWDAMTSDRPYRKALSHDAATAELRACAGSQFDPELVERFLTHVVPAAASMTASAPAPIAGQFPAVQGRVA